MLIHFFVLELSGFEQNHDVGAAGDGAIAFGQHR